MKNEKCLHLAQFSWFLWKYQCMTLYVSIKIILNRVDSCLASFIFRLIWVVEFAMNISVDISIFFFNILLNISINISMNMSKIVDSCFPDWVTGWLNLSLFMMGEYFDERFDKYFDEYSDEYFDKYYIIHPHLLSEDCSDAACKLPVPLGGWWPRKLK